MKLFTELVIRDLLSDLVIKKPCCDIVITDGNEGGFYDRIEKKLSIPKWIFYTDWYSNPDPTFYIYYISHELSHALVDDLEMYEHGPLFYSYFNQICPNHLKHWELDYLPHSRRFISV